MDDGRRQNELDKAVKQIGKNVRDVHGDISNPADLDRLEIFYLPTTN